MRIRSTIVTLADGRLGGATGMEIISTAVGPIEISDATKSTPIQPRRPTR
jgi:hypothetical protein